MDREQKAHRRALMAEFHNRHVEGTFTADDVQAIKGLRLVTFAKHSGYDEFVGNLDWKRSQPSIAGENRMSGKTQRTLWCLVWGARRQIGADLAAKAAKFLDLDPNVVEHFKLHCQRK
jgi:hypothetical protein